MSPLIDHETRLYLAAHPVIYPLLRLLTRFGPVIRVPGVGVVVNDAATARAVLMDKRFRKDGPGSPGDLWTPVLGPSVLLNMEGPAHARLRARLASLFGSGYVDRLVAEVLREPLADLAARLDRGESLDLANAVRVMAGAVICRVIGLGEVSPTRARELFEAGERVVSMVSLRSRRLSPRQVAIARHVLNGIGDIAEAAYTAGDENTVTGRMRGLGLTAAEARGAAGAFFLTGTETVATFVPRLVALLHDHRADHRVDHRADHRADKLERADPSDPADLGGLIDEAMRVTTPTPVMLRSVSAPAEVGGKRVRPGDRIVIVTHNCTRAYGPFDPDLPHPPELRRLWFGAGPHFCIGYPLAMAEITAIARVVAAPSIRVVRRRAARRVLIPAYRELWIRKDR
ncbi:Cytochrome P450 [Sinosporangium album]|uniref:Cytochrome P450 n=1 Tax=Sinosporangium album TaxID=504805 RepID=A0A1G8FF50_9ACTN|nr:cytochrome P450 [Sinosporangium album]SDH80682.1 Cytochrome P450 [Sinosporangium album]